MPKKIKHEVVPPTKSEVKRFMEHVETDVLFPFLRLLIITGLRKGKALGISIQDIDFVECSINIRHSVALVKNDNYKQSRRQSIAVLKGTRNIASKSKLWKLDDNNKMKLIDNELLFLAEDGDFLYPREVLDLFHKRLAEIGLPPHYESMISVILRLQRYWRRRVT